MKRQEMIAVAYGVMTHMHVLPELKQPCPTLPRRNADWHRLRADERLRVVEEQLTSAR